MFDSPTVILDTESVAVCVGKRLVFSIVVATVELRRTVVAVLAVVMVAKRRARSGFRNLKFDATMAKMTTIHAVAKNRVRNEEEEARVDGFLYQKTLRSS